MKLRKFLALSLLLFDVISAMATVIYVKPDDGRATKDGTSWATAYDEQQLQTAINSVTTHDEVWVAAGVYEGDLIFENATNVDLFGSFEGNEESSFNRSFTTPTTILKGTGESSVLTINDTRFCSVNGFEITNGEAEYGGGIHVNFSVSGLWLVNLVVTENKATQDGGGMFNGGDTNLLNSSITGNSAAGKGGGIYTGNFIKLESVLISGNLAETDGGGVYNDNADVSLTNVTIAGNHASGNAGGIYNRLFMGGFSELYNSIVIGNQPTGLGGDNLRVVDHSLIDNGYHNQNNNIILPNTGASAVFHTFAPATAGSATAGGNYRLLENSPAIDAGIDEKKPTISKTDLDNNRRIMGANIDMGAFEYRIREWCGDVLATRWNVNENWSDRQQPAEGENVRFNKYAESHLLLDKPRTVGSIYNHSSMNLDLNANTLTVNGVFDFGATPQVDGQKPNSHLILAGNDEQQTLPPFVNNAIANLTLGNTAKQFTVPNLVVLNDLRIEDGAQGMVVPANGIVTVGNQTYNTAAEAIRIQAAEPDGTLVNATFVAGAGSNVSATVELISKAKNTKALSEGLTTGEMQWQYFGIPVAQFQLPNPPMVWIREYVHGNSNHWLWLSGGSQMQAMTGYEISIPKEHDGKFEFTGQLVTTHQSYDVDYQASDRFAGQFVLSNPFTFGVNIATGVEFQAGKFENSIYLFNTGSSQQWDGHFSSEISETTNAPGQYTVFPQQTLSPVIPSMQGFVVKLAEGNESGGSISLKYDDNAAPNVALRSIREKCYTDIQLTSDGFLKDRVWLYTCPNTTRSFDNGYDGRKMFSSARFAQLYAPEEDANYQVKAVADIDSTLIRMKAEAGIREYTLFFHHNNLTDNYRELWLTDLATNEQIDITANGSVYHFTAGNEETAENRFLITTTRTATSIGNTPLANPISVHQEKEYVVIRNLSSENVNVLILNLDGRAVFSGTVTALSDRHVSTAAYPAGVYAVNILSGTESYSTKVYIKD